MALGAYVAAHVYGQPDNRERLLYDLAPRDIQGRGDLVEVAESELRSLIEELPADEQKLAWELFAANPI